ncbi:hypothetical protein HY488_01550 [Candidatus Woesearchaeota archaeon]|nr:hypothetical protein [Candidatus Woesearchaeota archaeon]
MAARCSITEIPVKGKYTVHTHYGSFDEGLASLKAEGLELITADALVNLWMNAGSQGISMTGSWTADGYVYLPNGETLVTRPEHNPILKRPGMAEVAVAAHKEGRDFYINPVGLQGRLIKLLRERAESDPIKALDTGVLLLPKHTVPGSLDFTKLDDPDESQLIIFLFPENRTLYGRYLQACGADIQSVSHVYPVKSSRQRAFANTLYLTNPMTHGAWHLNAASSLHHPSYVTGARYAEQLPTIPKRIHTGYR